MDAPDDGDLPHPPSASLKTDTGRLSKAGAQYLLALLRAGATDAEVARLLDIRPNAIHHRRQTWTQAGNL